MTSRSPFVLKIFVWGASPSEQVAVCNLRNVCEHHFRGNYVLDVVDVQHHPELAARERILATPTVVQSSPQSGRRLVGDFDDEDRVVAELQAGE